MRFLLGILIWVAMVGSVWLYTAARDARLPGEPARAKAVTVVQADFILSLTPTFSTQKDPFALDTGDESTSDLVIRLNGKNIDLPSPDMARGQELRISRLPALLPGFNEVYINAGPPVSESTLFHGIRVKLTLNGASMVDKTIWAGHGERVAGTVGFTLDPEKESGHD
ncbi:hypothetical protein [uncultured Desulfobacter sp.]|uniref:hypothetical protein n=1 Tax=uncultured Desulfobacter sp. TaxID=240139 RepID=UPI002AAAAE17|nr:hypothetical protein [uncultured Desulfobacter sp.]